jgi:hypothetical protein
VNSVSFNYLRAANEAREALRYACLWDGFMFTGAPVSLDPKKVSWCFFHLPRSFLRVRRLSYGYINRVAVSLTLHFLRDATAADSWSSFLLHPSSQSYQPLFVQNDSFSEIERQPYP